MYFAVAVPRVILRLAHQLVEHTIVSGGYLHGADADVGRLEVGGGIVNLDKLGLRDGGALGERRTHTTKRHLAVVFCHVGLLELGLCFGLCMGFHVGRLHVKDGT